MNLGVTIALGNRPDEWLRENAIAKAVGAKNEDAAFVFAKDRGDEPTNECDIENGAASKSQRLRKSRLKRFSPLVLRRRGREGALVEQ
jgi:hypothetical protein